MSRRPLHAIGKLRALLLAMPVALLAGCPAAKQPRPAPAARSRDVTLVQAQSVEGSDWAQALPGDWVLQSRQIRLVVGGESGRRPGRGRHGAIVAVCAGRHHGGHPTGVRPALLWGEVRLAPKTVRIEPEPASDPPRLQVVSESQDGAIRLETTIGIDAEQQRAEVQTRVSNRGLQQLEQLRVGHRVDWPGAPAFVPGVGSAADLPAADAAWVGREGRGVSHGVVFPDQPAWVRFVRDHVSHSGLAAYSPAVSLGPGQSVSHRMLLLVQRGSLAELARTAWAASGVATGAVWGRLQPAPSWATLEALDLTGAPILQAEADSGGNWRLPLPVGAYRVRLTAPGGTDELAAVIHRPGERTQLRLLAPQPGRIRFSVTDAQGGALPTRCRVRRLDSSGERAAAALPDASSTVVSLTGRGSFEVPPGNYEVTASRGPEYSVARTQVQVSEAQGASVRAQLSREVNTSGWLACDFHLHAEPSFDSELSLEQRVTALIAEAVEFAAATDHDRVTDYVPTIERLGGSGYLTAVRGVEITTRSWGHFNAFPLPAGVEAPAHDGLAPAALFAAVRRQAPAAVIQVNHPRLWDIGYFKIGGLDARSGTAAREEFSFDFDTIEVFNGSELAHLGAVQKNLVEWWGLLNLGRRYVAVGNSDSHRLTGQWAGYPRTYVRVETDAPDAVTPAEVSAALLSGRAVVTNGPWLEFSVNGRGPGETVRAKRQPLRLRVRVSQLPRVTATRVELVANGSRIFQRSFDVDSKATVLEYAGEARFERDAWVVAIVRGEEPLDMLLPETRALPLAFSNPVFVDADGDGRFTALYEAGPVPAESASD